MVRHLARVEERRGEHDDTELFENGHFDTEKDESFTLSWTSGCEDGGSHLGIVYNGWAGFMVT
jgi:hypothetical protein